MLANLLLISYMMIEPNYDEDKVPSYSLTDPLTFTDGRAVTQASDWLERRAEILQLFETEVYGQTPDKQLPMDVETFGENPKALDGAAIQEQVILRFGASSKEFRYQYLLILLMMSFNLLSNLFIFWIEYCSLSPRIDCTAPHTNFEIDIA